MRATVIIPAYNAEATIEKCVASVLSNTYSDFEVIVVDDRSTDNTRQSIAHISDKRLKVLTNESASGASPSRNFGVKASTGDILLFLDSDSYVGPDWVSGHMELHKQQAVDIAAGGIVGVFSSFFGRCDSFCSWWTSIPYSRDYFLKKLHIPTNNISVNKEAFRKIGLFSEELIYGGEDAEFCFRALKNGLNIYYKSGLIAYHRDKETWAKFIAHQRHWGKHAVRMRKAMNMDYGWLLPRAYRMAHFYIIPLAALFTGFIIAKWLRYRPSVILCAPVIFAGKIAHAAEIKNSFSARKAKHAGQGY